jgi:hypothetical protein
MEIYFGLEGYLKRTMIGVNDILDKCSVFTVDLE